MSSKRKKIVGVIVVGGFLAWISGIFSSGQSQAAVPRGNSNTGGGGLVLTVGRDANIVNDIDTLARTMWGEARSEGYRGMQAVANVIINRYEAAQASPAKARQYGRTIAEICKKKWQFSAWNAGDPNRGKMLSVTEQDPQFRTALEIARKAVAGTLPDITGGADHYHTKSLQADWSEGRRPITSHGKHVFFRLG